MEKVSDLGQKLYLPEEAPALIDKKSTELRQAEVVAVSSIEAFLSGEGLC